MTNNELIIKQTQKWIRDVVVGCNFCPFAAREVKRGSIRYEVISANSSADCLIEVKKAFNVLDTDSAVETLFLIIPKGFSSFTSYLQLVAASEKLLHKEKKEGVYQIASFHPAYQFADAAPDDPANYTNRSPYPMLHFLREESVSYAVDHYPTDDIPAINIANARQKGLAHMQQLLRACLLNE